MTDTSQAQNTLSAEEQAELQRELERAQSKVAGAVASPKLQEALGQAQKEHGGELFAPHAVARADAREDRPASERAEETSATVPGPSKPRDMKTHEVFRVQVVDAHARDNLPTTQARNAPTMKAMPAPAPDVDDGDSRLATTVVTKDRSGLGMWLAVGAFVLLVVGGVFALWSATSDGTRAATERDGSKTNADEAGAAPTSAATAATGKASADDKIGGVSAKAPAGAQTGIESGTETGVENGVDPDAAATAPPPAAVKPTATAQSVNGKAKAPETKKSDPTSFGTKLLD